MGYEKHLKSGASHIKIINNKTLHVPNGWVGAYKGGGGLE